MVVLFSNFCRTSMLSSTVAAPVHPPTILAGGVVSCPLDDKHSNKCEVRSRDFDLHPPMSHDSDHLFLYLLAICLQLVP